MSRGHPAVGTITITPDGPGKVRSQQGLRSGLVTVGVDPKYALRRTDRHPQPLPLHTLTMARLIDIDDARLAHRPLGVPHHCRYRRAHGRLGLRDGPYADVQVKHLLE